eukprot:TRINITY_DN1528_c0_g1_i1.p1 TRINITY_DN1528_c0_g1~~TRINITY_DN1528_c0_g1_i1.p1  ORF type:complete len:228 (-),score=48.15 TRINITY_DN1528_c0_g1_i1:189-872(-)
MSMSRHISKTITTNETKFFLRPKPIPFLSKLLNKQPKVQTFILSLKHIGMELDIIEGKDPYRNKKVAGSAVFVNLDKPGIFQGLNEVPATILTVHKEKQKNSKSKTLEEMEVETENSYDLYLHLDYILSSCRGGVRVTEVPSKRIKLCGTQKEVSELTSFKQVASFVRVMWPTPLKDVRILLGSPLPTLFSSPSSQVPQSSVNELRKNKAKISVDGVLYDLVIEDKV